MEAGEQGMALKEVISAQMVKAIRKSMIGIRLISCWKKIREEW